jgi:hypothetical protein
MEEEEIESEVIFHILMVLSWDELTRKRLCFSLPIITGKEKSKLLIQSEWPLSSQALANCRS